jgi:hypothetical protein
MVGPEFSRLSAPRRRRSKIKLLMLLATLAWPIGAVAMGRSMYVMLTDGGLDSGQAFETAATNTFVWCSGAWVVVMAFLVAIWFATRPD